MKILSDKPFIVIDLESGSYPLTNEGHEKFNEIRNSVTGKFYGYIPPWDGANIEELGGKRGQEYIEDVLVIYTKTAEGSKNRVISSYIENAKVYAKPQKDPKLNRRVLKDGVMVDCSYCVEADNLIKIEDIPVAPRFIINLSDYSTHMFRRQRFYKGKYPALDAKIIEYLENLRITDFEVDDIGFQEELQSTLYVDLKKATKNSSVEPQYSEGSHGKQVAKKVSVSKAALEKAGYKCEVCPDHKTFINKAGKPYMEGHHLIPCTASNAARFWNLYGVNIDCVENIVCLCPTCHRAIHYGDRLAKRNILKVIFSQKEAEFVKLGIKLTLKLLHSLYK